GVPARVRGRFCRLAEPRPGARAACARGVLVGCNPLATAAAKLYLQAGFTVVYQDIIIGPALAEVVAIYAQHPLSVIVVCPRPEVVAAREAARAKMGYSDESAVHAFDRVLRAETLRNCYWLDSSDLTIVETVDRILENLAQSSVVPSPAST